MGNIAIGSNTFSNVKLGNNQVKSVYLGNNLVWSNFTYLLDLYPATPAYHAYSVRKLRNLYPGFCLRIRRTTTAPNPVTTTTVDLSFDENNTISFSSNIVPVSGTTTAATTLGAFVAGTVDGFTSPSAINVVTWYDQSGNNKNVTQATPTAQPFLVTTAGALEVIDGSVAVRFNATNTQQLSLADASTSYSNMSCFVLSNSISATANTNAYGQGVLGNNARLQLPSGAGTIAISYNTAGTFPITGITANTDRLYELICGASTTSGYSNGIISSVASIASVITSNTVIRIGANGAAPSVYLNGYIKEAIAFTGFPSRTGVETNINSYYNVWV